MKQEEEKMMKKRRERAKKENPLLSLLPSSGIGRYRVYTILVSYSVYHTVPVQYNLYILLYTGTSTYSDGCKN